MADLSLNSILKKEEKKFRLSPKELVFKYIIYLPFIVAFVGISLFCAYIYLRYQIPYYNSSISLLIKDERGSRGSGGTEALDEIVLFKSRTNLANEIEVLKSATLMENVVKELGLNTQYWIEGNLKRSEFYNNRFFLYEGLSKIDSSRSFTVVLKFNDKQHFMVEGLDNQWYAAGQVIHGHHGDFKIHLLHPEAVNTQNKYSVQWQPPFSAAAGYAGGLGIRQLNNHASILKIDLVTEIPQKGIDILNGLVRAYNQSVVANKNKVIESTVKFIDDRLVLLSAELGKVEQGLQDFRQKNEIIDIETQGQSQFALLNENEEKLSELEVRIRVIDMIDEYVRNPQKKYSLVPSSLGIDDPTLQTMVASYNQLQLEREQKIQVMPAANPTVKAMEAQLENVRLSILESLHNIRKPAFSQRKLLLNEQEQLRFQVRSVPHKERELLEIARQQGIKEKLYLFLLQKREESAITMASSTSNAASIDPATSSWSPVSPDTSGTYRSAFLFGLLLPIGLIYLKELLNDKIVSRGDIVKATLMPISGEITHNKTATREMVIGPNNRSTIVEQFRMARTNLQYFIHDKKCPVILVTSSMPGEGKTFTSMNLGGVWALANKKTVILELDLRKPKISKTLGFQNRKGISNFILGDAALNELPVPVESIPNLYVVPAGPTPPNPSELLLEPRLQHLFDYLKQNFEIIIIDSAPVGLVSDAKVLSAEADATVYIVRQRFTPKKQLEFVNDIYINKVFPNCSLLVNDVKQTGINSYYGYGYGYGYMYGYNYNYSLSYNYGYNDEPKKKGWLTEKISSFKNLF